MLVPILLFATLNGTYYARFTSLNDAEILHYISEITTIAEDGSAVIVSEQKYKVLKEQGRESCTNFHFTYNAVYSEVEIIEAKTMLNGSEYYVPKENIELKPLASNPRGFDQKMQTLIRFSNVEIGAEIYIKKVEKLKSILDGYFSANMVLDYPLQSFSSKFISKIPLHIKVNDPENALKIVRDKIDSFHELEIFLKMSVYRNFTGASENGGIINKEKLIFLSLSSEKNWETLSDRMAPHYEKVLSQKLPTVFENIAAKVAKCQNNVDLINTVTSLLSGKVEYMGDWRSISGEIFPRDLEAIASSQTGDCKDISSSAGAILRSLGFKVNVALVARGLDIHPNYIGLPALEAFNHAFLKVIAKDGSVYWIDPTNDISMAQNTFRDIAGKVALVLDMQNPSYERVPYTNYESTVSFTERDITLLGGSKVFCNLALSLQGESASTYKVAARLSRESLNKEDVNYVELPDLQSRIVKDLSLKLSFYDNNFFTKTNFGLGVRLESFDELDTLFQSSEERVTDILMTPEKITHKILLKGIVAHNINTLNFSASNDWFDLSRKISHNSQGIEILTELAIKHAIIPGELTETEEFQSLRDYYLNNFADALLFVEQ